MPRTRRTSRNISRDDALREVVAVLQANPESTDSEIVDTINRWLVKRGVNLELLLSDVIAKRAELEIPPSDRKPFQRGLF